MTNGNLREVYHQSLQIFGADTITRIAKRDVNSWLAKENCYQNHTPASKVINLLQ